MTPAAEAPLPPFATIVANVATSPKTADAPLARHHRRLFISHQAACQQTEPPTDVVELADRTPVRMAVDVAPDTSCRLSYLLNLDLHDGSPVRFFCSTVVVFNRPLSLCHSELDKLGCN